MPTLEATNSPNFINRLSQAILAGGIGGTTGDMLMHSLDTVKTRQQGDPHMPPKYTSMGNTYYTIWRQEGISRGLYGGVQPAFVGSFLGTCAFFGTYEWSKRMMIDYGVAPSVSYFTAGTSNSTRHLIQCDRHAKTTRSCCRSRRCTRLRPIRSPQNSSPTPRPSQQPVFQLGLQLPLHP